jgi:transcriptional regulator with XRE-family HTH domain
MSRMKNILKTSKIGRDPYDIQIGSNLRQLRLRRGLSLTALGESVGVNYKQVQKYESAQNRLPVSTLIRIAHLLRVDVFYLLAGIEGIEPPRQAEATELNTCLARIHEKAPLAGERLSELVQAIADIEVAIDKRKKSR